MTPPLTFNAIAELYHNARPGYPPEAWEAVQAYSGIGKNSQVAESGPGTGQATAQLVEWGCEVWCAEPGAEMARLLRERFQNYPRLQLQETTFEDWDAPEEAFDLVLAATSFHWVRPDVGYPKVQRLLKSGGALCLFWNDFKESGTTVLARRVQGLHREFKAAFDDVKRRRDPFLASDKASESWMRDSGLFIDYQFHSFTNIRRFSSTAYANLVTSHSTHQMLPPDVLTEFRVRLRDIIDDEGGYYDKPIRTDVYLARKA